MEKLNRRNDNILAEGEATGHTHCVIGDDVAVYGEEENRLLKIPKGGTVKHEEHKKIVLPPGDYDIGIVKEYDYTLDKIIEIVD